MKRSVSTVAMIAVVGALTAMNAVGQTRPTSPADRPAASRGAKDLHDTRDIIGVRIKNLQGKDVGEIDALLLDPKDGKVTHAVVGVGGVLGIGEQRVMVPWSDVKISMDHDRMVVNLDQATLERAPRYERKLLTGNRDRSAPAATPATAPTDPKTDKKQK